MGVEHRELVITEMVYVLHCDESSCEADIGPEWAQDGLYETARKYRWTERDGKWYCPAHAERPGAEKGGETR